MTIVVFNGGFSQFQSASASTTFQTTSIQTSGMGCYGPNYIALVSVTHGSSSITTTSIAAAGSGTFSRLVSATGSAFEMELWLGYNFTYPTGSGAVTITRSAGTATWAMVWCFLELDQNVTTLPTVAATSTNSGTGTTADVGTMTPNVGDIIFCGQYALSASAPTARANTGNTYVSSSMDSTSSGNTQSAAWGQATAGVSTGRALTISSAAWAGAQVAITPPSSALSTPSAFAYKGRDTAAQDTGTVA